MATTVVTALATMAVTALLINIFTRKQEAKVTYLRVVDVSENTSDPAQWGKNHAREYNSYLRTAEKTDTQFGGWGGSEAAPTEKADRTPWLKTMFAGYAFAIDYRDRRGHAYMLQDQESTDRVLKKPQPGACLHCHASIIPTYRRVGMEEQGKDFATSDEFDFNMDAVIAGYKKMSTLTYVEARAELLKTPDGPAGSIKAYKKDNSALGTAPTTQAAIKAQAGKAHPVSCVDCHDPKSNNLRVSRPGFVIGIQAMANSSDAVPHLPSVERWRKGDRKKPYDPNTEASRQEMRSFVCAQCHVEYYCGPKTTMFFPWGKGLKVEQIESYYNEYKFPDGHRFFDWAHADTGAEVLKAQHPEFEMWSQGIHARSGVACADCHMPYTREGALKVSDHWIRSPLLNINRSCQVCHHYEEAEIKERVLTIQNRNYELMNRGGNALVELIGQVKSAKASGASAEQLKDVLELQRAAQWRLDFVAAENSMGFHAPQETARILGDSIDLTRKAQLKVMSLKKD